MGQRCEGAETRMTSPQHCSSSSPLSFGSPALPRVLEWVLLLGALGAFTITEEFRPYVAWGLGALAVSFAVRWIRTRHPLCHTGLEGPWLLFVASAGVGLWAAYDRPLALLKFARILAAMVLYYALAESDERTLQRVAAGLVLLATGLALYWPTQHDFFGEPAKLAIITRLGQWINVHVRRLPGPSIHGNVAGATLALALPFAVVLSWDLWRQRRRGKAIIGVFLSLVLAGGLVLTSNRGGWLSLTTAAGLALLVWAQRRWFAGPRGMVLVWGMAAVLALVFGIGVITTGNLDRVLGMIPDPSGALQGRSRLWGQGLGLARDYAFTGSGLATFPMVYSMYSILIHVPFHSHIHNTYLEVWIEQGVLGALALLWGGAIMLAWAWQALRSDRVPLLAWAGLAALVVTAVHSVFDVAFYGARTLPLLGLVAGCASNAVRTAQRDIRNTQYAIRQLFLVLAVLSVAALVLRHPLLGIWHANLGAVAQTQVELGAYDPARFDSPTIDLVRQREDLRAAEREFARALEWDALNLTTLQRLGTIALSRAEYERGLTQLQAAWETGHRDDVTRLLLGDALVATGQAERAAETVRGLTWAEMRLAGQAWYRYWVNEDYSRAADAWAAVLLLNPDNEEASRRKAQAETRARSQ